MEAAHRNCKEEDPYLTLQQPHWLVRAIPWIATWARRHSGKFQIVRWLFRRQHAHNDHHYLVCSLVFVSNHLPLIVKRDDVSGWIFEKDEDALIAQAKEGLPEDMEAVYVGCLPVEVDGSEQEVRDFDIYTLIDLTTMQSSEQH